MTRIVMLRTVIESTLEIAKVSLPEKLLKLLELATTVTPLEGKVVVVDVGMVVVVVVVVVVGDVVVVGATLVDVVTELKVVVVVISGAVALSAPSHSFGVPNTTGVTPIGAATRTFPD